MYEGNLKQRETKTNSKIVYKLTLELNGSQIQPFTRTLCPDLLAQEHIMNAGTSDTHSGED